jgi:AGCS family alanine or glycine:cation symporter
MDAFFALLDAVNAVMLSVPVLLALLGVGVLFTFWSGFCQYRSLTHGFRLVSGRTDMADNGKGVLSHFQALSAALSATVGLGNIGGVAIAVALGGPGAVFWMWMVGLVGMAIKTTEVTLAMVYRDTSDPANPHGGTMWVCREGLPKKFPQLKRLGWILGGAFSIPLIVFGITGGNMFQAWNAAELGRAYFGIPTWISGLVLASLVAVVIIGGIRRIGLAASMLVPVMCGIYVLCGIGVLLANASALPDIFRLIFVSAFSPAEATGAFTGAAVGSAFIFGMKRALFSSEAGIGSAPIAHSAVKTREPASEGVVAGLEPFIDTLVVCTITALVILSSGIWSRAPVAEWYANPALIEAAPGQWAPNAELLPESLDWQAGSQIFVVVETDSGERARIFGSVAGDNSVSWRPISSAQMPVLVEHGIFADLPAAALTAAAFDSAYPGLGRWMVTLAVWLFALSTMITWSYYSEQGVTYLLGQRWVFPFRLLWCALILVATLGLIRTDAELDTLSTVALGFMLAINLPVMVVLGSVAMRAHRDYTQRIIQGRS